jgi:hypothetical protein
MVEESAFRGIVDFLGVIGVYDVVLPFLLVFTIVFAILEKTKILGVEKVGDQSVTKKNLNSIVALIIAFFVIASTKLVAVINEVTANVVLLLILAICFLLLVGVFFGDQEFTLKDYPNWIKFFMVVMFIGVVVIFLNALTFTTAEGETFTWLEVGLSVFTFWDEAWAATLIFLVIIIGFLWFITKEPSTKKEKKKDKE